MSNKSDVIVFCSWKNDKLSFHSFIHSLNPIFMKRFNMRLIIGQKNLIRIALYKTLGNTVGIGNVT